MRVTETVGRETDRVYQTLRRLILDNVLTPGSTHLQEELSKRLGVSRTPIREAIVRLEEDGLVQSIPRRGIRIKEMSIDDMREIYEMLAALESEAAYWAARRGISDDQFKAIEAALSAMETALNQGDLEAWAEADEGFHALLAEASGNRRLMRAIQQLADQAHRARRITLWSRPPPVQSNLEHRAMIEALKSGDCTLTSNIHRQHRRQSSALLLRLLGDGQAAGGAPSG